MMTSYDVCQQKAPTLLLAPPELAISDLKLTKKLEKCSENFHIHVVLLLTHKGFICVSTDVRAARKKRVQN